MEPNSFIWQARRAARCGASGKRRNAPDGRIWSTEGRILAPAGRRYAPLEVSQTTARSLPSQQTRETGQTIPYYRIML